MLNLGYGHNARFMLIILAKEEQNWHNFLMVIDTHFPFLKDTSESNDSASAFWYSQLERQTKIKKHFVNSVVCTTITTAITTIFSLVYLCRVPYFAENPKYGQWCLFVSTFLACLCVFSFTTTILLSLGKYPNWIGWLKGLPKRLKNLIKPKKKQTDGVDPASTE